jgi:putative ABC transport system permease protein
MGLLLSRFLARAAEISVRRALGAKRLDIFLQHVIESEIMALAGGLLGLALAAASLWLVNGWFKVHAWGNRDDFFRMDPTMAWFAVTASLLAGLIAGVYPALRVCRVAPASHLKIQ